MKISIITASYNSGKTIRHTVESVLRQTYPDFEYIVVDNEAEALILECNLIKKNRPKFNVLLKRES